MRCWHYIRSSFFKKLLYFCLIDPYKHGHGPRSWLPLLVRRLFSPAFLHQRLQHILAEFDYDKNILIADHDYKPHKGIIPKEVFGEPKIVNFEDIELTTVAQPDYYLRQLYGNYMELPKELPPQNFRYLDLHKPYREYGQ